MCFAAVGCFLDFLFDGGFKIGRPAPKQDPRQWFSLFIIASVSVCYIVTAHRGWSHALWVFGLTVHCAYFLMLLFALCSGRTGGFIVLPAFLIGPAVWIMYARHARRSKGAA